MELTGYMKRDLYFAGFKAFNSGVSECPFTTAEWAALWQKGWDCARNEASEV